MNYSDSIPVLNSKIPNGGFGRNITSAEAKNIREWGFSCSEKWIVVRAYDSPNTGILYYPSKTGSGYEHARIFVKTK